MIKPKTSEAMTAPPNPIRRARRPRPAVRASRRVPARAMLVTAPYSGPTTMAATIRICELIKMPTAAMRPATTSRTYQLGG